MGHGLSFLPDPLQEAPERAPEWFCDAFRGAAVATGPG